MFAPFQYVFASYRRSGAYPQLCARIFETPWASDLVRVLIGRMRWSLILLAGIGINAGFLGSAQAQAVLVQNTDQTETSDLTILHAGQHGLHQGFRTGPNDEGYELSSVSLYVGATNDSRHMRIDAGLYRGDRDDDLWHAILTKVASLTRIGIDDYAHNEWMAPANTFLDPNTNYYIVLNCTSGCENDNRAQFGMTRSDREDPGAESGWSIHDRLGFRRAGTSKWKLDINKALRIQVTGRPGPYRAYEAEIISTPANELTYRYGENIDIVLKFNTEVSVGYDSVIGIRVGDATDGSNYREARVVAGSGHKRLLYRYQVGSDDFDATGISVDASGLGGTLPTVVSTFGTVSVIRYYPGLADDPDHKVDGSLQVGTDTATGTIENDDPLQQAWLARFSRTAAQRVLDGVQARLRAPHEAGMQATVAGRDLSGAGEVVAQDRFKAQSEWVRGEATEAQFGPQSLTMRDLVTKSAFTLSSETVGGFGTLWGRGAYSGFDGRDNGLSLDGGAMTGMFGADYAVGRWVVGLPLAHSRGDGSWHSAGLGAGRMASSLTGLYPYAGYELADRLSLWGTAGYGQGDLALMMQEGKSYHTAMDLTMAAVGVRGDLVSRGQVGGLSLAIESDALLVRTTSEAVSDPSGLLASAVADVSRLRLGLEGSLDLALAAGRSLTPTIELGLRHDGGDAETGFGVEMGGGTVFVDAARGLMAQVMVRGLVAHEAADFRDWRVSGLLRFDPTPSSALGPAVALTPSWGAPSSGGVAVLLGRETLVGLSAYEAVSVGRLDAEAAYGLAVFGGRALGTPYLEVGQSEAFREVRMGYRLELLRWEGLEMGIEGTQRASAVDNMAPDREVMLHLAFSAP